uniref:Eukaryotic translation initiation factor 2 alpha kinase 2 n=1 Tax=Catharus ustulatus TaxID=91951 RepID=A0A8C3VBC0_CATUS
MLINHETTESPAFSSCTCTGAFAVLAKWKHQQHPAATPSSQLDPYSFLKGQESPSNMAAAEIRTSQPISSPPLDKDFVSLLNVYSQRTRQMIDYTNVARDGDPHAPMYTVFCKISGCVCGRGTGPSLIAAKQAAAKEAFEKVNKESSLTVSYSMDSVKEGNNPYFSMLVGLLLVEFMLCFCLQFWIKTTKTLRVDISVFQNRSDILSFKVAHILKFSNVVFHFFFLRFLDLFEEIEPIDKGGFGTVFKATSKSDKTTYAIKRVKFTEYREAKGLAILTHENIVRYHCSWRGYDCIKDPDSRRVSVTSKNILCLFIQMEFCEQGTLENWIAKNEKNRQYHAKAQNQFLQIVKGVEYIHSKDLIHRDLKPQNIFISRDDKIKIGDFGLVTSVAFETLTEDRGTKSYMAPEQSGDRYGKEVDIYALGLIWFEILSAITGHEKSRVISTKSKPLQFSKMKKNYLEHIALSETDIFSKRNSMLLKLFKKVILYVF